MKKGHTEATYEFPINNMLLECANRAAITKEFHFDNDDDMENAKEIFVAVKNGLIDIDSHYNIYLMTNSVSSLLRGFVSEKPSGKETQTKEEAMFQTWVFNEYGVHPYGTQRCSYYKWNEKATRFEIRSFGREKMEEEFDGKLDNVVLLDSFFKQ